MGAHERVIAKRKLREYWEKVPETRSQLESWHAFTKEANWRTPADVKKALRTASVLSNNRVVFNIKGNKYRLNVNIIYEKQLVFIRFVGTHAEYDRIDAENV